MILRVLARSALTDGVPALCAVAAVATCLAGALAAMGPHLFNATTLVHMGASEPMAGAAHETDHGFVLWANTSHYDGVYNYTIARDPLLRGTEHKLIDRSSYRYAHPGFGWLAWLASAGRPLAVPDAMLALVLACAGIAGAAASLLARDLGSSPWWGLSVALNPGLVFSATVLTGEAIGLAALLVGIYAWRRRNGLIAGIALAIACFIKEPYLLVPIGLAVYELVSWLRTRRASTALSLRAVGVRLIPLAAGPLLFALWYVYVWWELLIPPREQATDLTVLFTGWVDTFKLAAAYTGGDQNAFQIGATTIPLLVVAGCALVAGMIRSLRADSELQLVFLPLALVAFSLNKENLLFPKDVLRALAVQIALMPFVFATRRRRDALPASANRPARQWFRQ